MKRVSMILTMLVLILCACGASDEPSGAYIARDNESDYAVILENGYCLIDVLYKQDEKSASAAVGGRYTFDDGKLLVEVTEGELDGERFEFTYDKKENELTNVADGKVYEKKSPSDEIADGEYAYEDGTESYSLTIDGNSCTLHAHSVNEKGESADAVETGKVTVDENVVEIKLGDSNYRFIYAEYANVLMDTSDGRMYYETETEE